MNAAERERELEEKVAGVLQEDPKELADICIDGEINIWPALCLAFRNLKAAGKGDPHARAGVFRAIHEVRDLLEAATKERYS